MRLADFFHPHNPTLVVVSLSVAVLAAYVSLDLARQISTARGWVRLAWLAAGSVSLGGGIWAMHFIGMLALILPVPVRYDVPLTVVSFAIPIPLAAVGLYLAHWQGSSSPRVLLGGTIIGAGISVMHYTGMAALRMPAMASYEIALVALSVIIAITASTAALWLASMSQTAIIRLCGSSLGIAISGLHYTGVAGFICTPTNDTSLPLTGLSPSGLAPWVAGVSLVFLWNVLVFGIYDRRLFARAVAEAHRLDLLTVQEEERLRFARELHDQMGQDLTGLSLMLKSIEPAVQTEEARVTIQQLKALTADMDRKVHDLAWELRPRLPQAGGLRSALENYLADWSARFKVKVDFHGIGLDDHDLPLPLETTIFSIVQEAFTNVVKHAAATSVSLTVARDCDWLTVIVKDDGKGLGGEAATPPGQLGLVGIKERLSLFGGTLSVEAAQPNGTLLTFSVPLASAARKPS